MLKTQLKCNTEQESDGCVEDFYEKEADHPAKLEQVKAKLEQV